MKDARGQKLGYFYYGEEPGGERCQLLTRDEASRIATGLSCQGCVAYNCRIEGDGDASIDAASASGWLVCSRPMTAKPKISATSVALGLATAIVVLSVVPPALRPETGLPHGLEHFVIYWATGVAFALGYELKLGLLATLLMFFLGAVEFAQLFVPGRHARLSDFIVDALATIVGAMTVSLVAQKPVLHTAQTADRNMDESQKP
jgi:VanZ family protein